MADIGGLTYEIALQESKNSLNIAKGIAIVSSISAGGITAGVYDVYEKSGIAMAAVFGAGALLCLYITKGAVQDCGTISHGIQEDPIKLIKTYFNGVAEKYGHAVDESA